MTTQDCDAQIKQLTDIQGEALTLAIQALGILAGWGEPYTNEATVALEQISKKLAEAQKV